MGLFGFPAKANTVTAEKRHACTALDISNIRTLNVKFYLFGMLFFNTFQGTYRWKNFVFQSLLLPLTKFLNFLHVEPKLHTSTADNTSF
jgi:hypothetical protein